MANPFIGLKAIRIGSKIAKGLIKKARARKLASKPAGGGSFQHNLGKMVQSRKTKGLLRGQQSKRLKYAEKPPNFKNFSAPKVSKGSAAKKRAAKRRILRGTYPSPNLKGGQVQSNIIKHNRNLQRKAAERFKKSIKDIDYIIAKAKAK